LGKHVSLALQNISLIEMYFRVQDEYVSFSDKEVEDAELFFGGGGCGGGGHGRRSSGDVEDEDVFDDGE
jgi:hypothetical protein